VKKVTDSFVSQQGLYFSASGGQELVRIDIPAVENDPKSLMDSI
jgi:hypothetical protein